MCIKGYASTWKMVTSGVPQGSVLGPLSFLIFINDLDEGIINSILKFADDTKIFGPAQCHRDREYLQKDLEKLVSWAEQWQMVFNVDKCKVMHMGRSNEGYTYMMNGLRGSTRKYYHGKRSRSICDSRSEGVISVSSGLQQS